MDYLKLSKEVSYALRHAPLEYELELDENGWVEVKQLLSSLRECRECWHVNENDLHTMIAVSEKKRHEISDGKIRALYGHSIPQRIMKEPKDPPEILYHGTARCFIQGIMDRGLLPQNRQYVHLSADTDTAIKVGKRRDNEPIILKIYAKKAWNKGLAFYQGNDKVWLADKVPSEFISIY